MHNLLNNQYQQDITIKLTEAITLSKEIQVIYNYTERQEALAKEIQLLQAMARTSFQAQVHNTVIIHLKPKNYQLEIFTKYG